MFPPLNVVSKQKLSGLDDQFQKRKSGIIIAVYARKNLSN